MGLRMDEIAQIVVLAEPPQCPLCGKPDFADWAAASVAKNEDTEEEAVLVSYHCEGCGSIVHTFA